jgi:hypothetical protein
LWRADARRGAREAACLRYRGERPQEIDVERRAHDQ